MPASGCVGDKARADRLAFLRFETDAMAVRVDMLDTGVVLDCGAVVYSRISQVCVRILTEQVRFIAFPVRWDD